MRITCLFTLLALLFFATASAQKKNFSGLITYQNSYQVRLSNMTENELMFLFGKGTEEKLYISGADMYRQTPYYEIWTKAAEGKAYYRFSGIDTLYIIALNKDTAIPRNVDQPGLQFAAAGHQTKAIRFRGRISTTTYHYSDQYYLDPSLYTNHRNGNFYHYLLLAQAPILASITEAPYYTFQQKAVAIEETDLADSLFVLPRLPHLPYDSQKVEKAPVFEHPAGSFMRYIYSIIKADLAARYLTIPKKQSEARQEVMVGFIITKEGKVADVHVVNQAEVHPKLAEEAKRVVSLSPEWKPATRFGKPVSYILYQPITFVVQD